MLVALNRSSYILRLRVTKSRNLLVGLASGCALWFGLALGFLSVLGSVEKKGCCQRHTYYKLFNMLTQETA